ncbi:hypothetical protein EYF80_055972 [Liparis tanakae]|uniref:Uncharacterized protein n=1 Tax=Liparis tanakae TaxID=230148 RepID=A0A4Z2EYA3_9TELE|nr:hypothetical protein EYF80_055972 [Liparis tanakae]
MWVPANVLKQHHGAAWIHTARRGASGSRRSGDAAGRRADAADYESHGTGTPTRHAAHATFTPATLRRRKKNNRHDLVVFHSPDSESEAALKHDAKRPDVATGEQKPALLFRNPALQRGQKPYPPRGTLICSSPRCLSSAEQSRKMSRTWQKGPGVLRNSDPRGPRRSAPGSGKTCLLRQHAAPSASINSGAFVDTLTASGVQPAGGLRDGL